MNLFTDIKGIYIIPNATDLRKGIDGYAAAIQTEHHLNPMDRSLYIFCNKAHNKIKCLYYDGTGWWLLYKRLEVGTFKWKKTEDGTAVQISEQQYRWLLEGLKMDQKTAFREIERKFV